MSIHVFTVVLIGGAALLALWAVVRFPSLTPRSAPGATLSMAIALLGLAATPPAVMVVGNLAGLLAAAFLVVLPAATCIFAAIACVMVWVIRMLQPHLG